MQSIRRVAFISVHGCPVARLGEKDTGGMNVYLLQTARELGRLGTEVDVYTRCHDPRDPKVVRLGPRARVVHLEAGPHAEEKGSLPRHVPRFVRRLYEHVRAEGLHYDLVHSHYWLSGVAGESLAREQRVPHVTTFHTLAEVKERARVGSREPARRRSCERRLMRSADRVVAFSEAERNAMVTLYGAPRSRLRVLAGGVDTELFSPRDRQASKRSLALAGNRVVLFVGRLDPIKSVDLLPRAIALLEDMADVRLLVVGGRRGDGEAARLRRLARELGVEERVELAGTVDQRELPRYYSAADVLVVPSYYESFGLVALEAMACGTPVLAYRAGGLPTFVRDGETGYLVPWRCPGAFAERLEVLLGNEALRSSMGRAARESVAGLTWRSAAGRLLELYQETAGLALGVA